jgi:hypothetical protein
MHLADVPDDVHSGKKRLKSFSIGHMQLRAATKFSGKFVKGWLKIIFPKEHARQFQLVQFVAKLLGIDERRAENFERPRCASPFGNICAFEQTHTWVNSGRVECRHVR